MHRTFVTSRTRVQLDLSGSWDFSTDPDDRGLAEEWYSTFPEPAAQLWVPGVWNTSRPYLNYHGPAWYRYRFDLPACRAAKLCFAAVSHQANVWLDGEPLGDHYGGYAPFGMLVKAPEPGRHELVVRVDNTHDSHSTIPSDRLDWFRYGGIPRPVWVEILQSCVYVDSLRVTPVLSGRHAAVNVRAEIGSLATDTREAEWTLTMDGQILRSDRITVEHGSTAVLMFGQEIGQVDIWSPENPRLYEIRLSADTDDLVERTGFREITVRGQQILMNGTPLTIRGVNRHEDHPEWGPALPDHLMLRDLDILKHWGGNAIRGSHYPNDQRFLDYCDEKGVLFIEEIPLWGFRSEQLASDVISDRATAMVWAMVERDTSHPSIWAWSVLNECATDTLIGRTLVERLVDTVREIDRTRPVTYATDRGPRDRCTDLVDFICVNAYPGWYTHDSTWPQLLSRMRALVGDKPLVVSEFGAGAVYGWRSLEPEALWSEEYQAKVLTDAIACFTDRADITGFFVWQFFDTRTDRGADGTRGLTRPRGYNNKGLLNEYRQPKLAFYRTRDLLAQDDTEENED